MTNQAQLSWSSGHRGVPASLVARVQLVPRTFFFAFFPFFFSFSPSYSCQNTNYHFIRQRKHSKPKLFNKQKQTTLCHLFHTFHSITAIKTPSMYTWINTTNHTELRWSSGYRDTTIVTPTRFNSGCRTILFFLFLQLLVVKIPNIILSDRRNAENQSYLSKKKQTSFSTYSTHGTA